MTASSMAGPLHPPNYAQYLIGKHTTSHRAIHLPL